jgi:hypothetical protein
MRWSNSDPITGQAAWFDLRVRIEKAEEGDAVSEPQFPVQDNPVDSDHGSMRYGKEWTK